MLLALLIVCTIREYGRVLGESAKSDGCTDFLGQFHKKGSFWIDKGGKFNWTCTQTGQTETVGCITVAGQHIVANQSLQIGGSRFTCGANEDKILVLSEYDGCADVNGAFHVFGEMLIENLHTVRICAGANEFITVNCSCAPIPPPSHTRSVSVTSRITTALLSLPSTAPSPSVITAPSVPVSPPRRQLSVPPLRHPPGCTWACRCICKTKVLLGSGVCDQSQKGLSAFIQTAINKPQDLTPEMIYEERNYLPITIELAPAVITHPIFYNQDTKNSTQNAKKMNETNS